MDRFPVPRRTPLLLVVLTVATAWLGCADDRLLIELHHPAAFDPALQQGNLEVRLLSEGGELVHRTTLPLARLQNESSIGEGLALERGQRYRLVLSATLTTNACASAASGSRAVGTSPLFVHGRGATTVAVYVDCANGSSATGQPLEKRIYHTASLLSGSSPEGLVLIAGGVALDDITQLQELQKGRLPEALEVYDPLQKTFRRLEISLSRGRVWHQATRVGDDKVVLTGGATIIETVGVRRFVALGLVDAIDAGQRVTQLGELAHPRFAHNALLVKERLLIAGGTTDKELLTDSAELYDVGSRLSLGTIAPLGAKRTFAMAAKVGENGDALISGGLWLPGLIIDDDRFCLEGSACGCQAPCFAPVTSFPRGEGRTTGVAVTSTCADGKGAVYVLGGRHEETKTGIAAEVYRDIYCYDLAEPKALRRIGELAQPRSSFTASLVRPATGKSVPRILAAGGGTIDTILADAELFSAPCQCPTQLPADEPQLVPLAEARSGHTATVLPDGSVLLVGGFPNQSTAERFVPSL